MKQIYNSTLGRILLNKKYKRIAVSVFIPLFIAAAILTGIISQPHAFTDGTQADGNDYINTYKDGGFYDISGNYNLLPGAKDGFNFYHIEGTSNSQPFWRDTFCTHKDYNSGSGSFKYYYNAVPDDATNNDLLTTVLGYNGIGMTLSDWQHLRYCIAFTNMNGDAFGQSVYWAYLAYFIPQSYSGIAGWGGGTAKWNNDWDTSYIGPAAVSDFMGLGPIAAGDTLKVGAQCDFVFSPNGTVMAATGNQTVLGPYSIDWKPGSDAVLAQLNCGKDKQTTPTFNLSIDNSYSGLLRFYTDAACTSAPISSVSLGQKFYVKFNVNSRFAPDNLQKELPITVRANQYITTKICGDQFFLHPAAQNQLNVRTESNRPDFNFNVKFDKPDLPPIPEPPVPPAPPVPGSPDYPTDYDRPTVDKSVTEDNHLDDAGGNYQDVMQVATGTDVLHKMTVTSVDPKGTVLTFQNTDYDLHPTAATTVQVRTAAELKAAIDANNKNIKQMADITIPSDWTASQTIFTHIFDGNGFKLTGDGGIMTAPIFYKTNGAVFFRVQLVNFTMQRSAYSTTVVGGLLVDPTLGNGNSIGTIVDYFGDSAPGDIGAYNTGVVTQYTADKRSARMIDCYVEGSLTFDYHGANATSSYNNYTGGMAGQMYGAEISGCKALINIKTTNSSWNRNNYVGGMFGVGNVCVFENNELKKGSVLFTTTAFAGGMVCRFSVNNGNVLNCTADYEYTNVFADGANHPENYYFGGLFQTFNGVLLMDRCSATIKWGGYYYGYGDYNNGLQWRTTCFGGLVSVDSVVAGGTKVTNCSAVYTGLPVVVNGVSGGASNMIRSTNNTDYTIENCYTVVNMYVLETGAGAGIFARENYPAPASANRITIKNCYAEGNITVVGSGVAAGIAVGGPTNTQNGVNSSLIANCVSRVNINIANVNARGDAVAAGTPKIAGIWANASAKNVSNVYVMTVRDCLFTGVISDPYDVAGTILTTYNNALAAQAAAQAAADADPGNAALAAALVTANTTLAAAQAAMPVICQIYNCLPGVTTQPLIDGNPTGTDNNYTVNAGFSNKQDANGQTVTETDFFNNTGGLIDYDLTDQSLSWYFKDGQIKFAPKTVQPVQRIYVTDYYDTNADTNGSYLVNPGASTVQQFIDRLYILDGTTGKLIKMWDAINASGANNYVKSGGTGATDPQAYIDFLMNGSTFTFYMKVPDIDFRSPSAPPRADNAYQNIVKIVPRDSMGKDNWMGAWDDDWVTVKDVQYYLNIIKMTSADNYPMPLDGTEFTLYMQGPASWNQIEKVYPQGYAGATFTNPLESGNYKLVETAAPQYYDGNGGNVGRTWYLSLSGGVLSMYTDAAMTIPAALGQDSSNNTVTFGAVLYNKPDSNSPKATVKVEKYDDKGNKIVGTMENGTPPRFTGANYALEKFADASEFAKEFNTAANQVVGTGAAYGYGNMILCGVNDYLSGGYIKDFCDIIPGYYRLVEKDAPDGYAVDPTVFYIVFDSNASPTVKFYDPHTGTVNDNLSASSSWDPGSNTLTVKAKDTKPAYKITLQKYNTKDNSAIDGINFELINTLDNSVLGTYTTAGTNGEVTITVPPAPDGTYIIREALTDTQFYTSIPDYTVEVRNGELYIKGGPNNYNFKVVNGQRDHQYYVIQDPDGAAIQIYDGVYPKDVSIDQNDALTIGLVHVTLGVPNTPVKSTNVIIKGQKVVVGTDAPDETFNFKLIQVADATGKDYAGTPITETTSRVGAGSFSFDPIALKPGVYYFKITENNNGTANWTYDKSVYLVKVVVTTGGLATVTSAANTGTNTWPPENEWK